MSLEARHLDTGVRTVSRSGHCHDLRKIADDVERIGLDPARTAHHATGLCRDRCRRPTPVMWDGQPWPGAAVKWRPMSTG